MTLGTDVHAHVEHRLLNGVWRVVEDTDKYNRKTLRVAMSNEHLLPDEKVEKKWVEASLRINAGTMGIELPVIGYIDWLEPFNNRVNDHKTQSDSRWSLSEMELRRDPQAIIYGKFALLRYPTVFNQPNIKFRHIYYPTTSRSRPDTTEVTLSLREIDEGFDAIVERTAMMVADANCEEVKDVLPNTAACGDYGGCPFKRYCEVVGDLGEFNPFEAFEHKDTGVKKMGLFDKIKAGAAKPSINPPQEEKKKESERPMLTKEELLVELKKLTPGEVGGFKLIPQGGQRWIMREVKAGTGLLVAMNRAISKVSKREGSEALVAKIVETMHKITEGQSKKVSKPRKAKAVAPKKEEPDWAGLAKSQIGTTDDASTKKFERKVSDNPLENYTVGDALKSTEENIVVEDAPNVNTRFEKKELNPSKYSYLFVDCMPRHTRVTFFDDWIKPLVEQVLTANRAKHYMLPPLDYGKGKAEIQCALSVWLQTEGNRLPSRMNVSRRHALADVFIAETSDMWHEIVEG